MKQALQWLWLEEYSQNCVSGPAELKMMRAPGVALQALQAALSWT